MPDPEFDTVNLTDLLGRLRAGDPAARNDLLRATQARLERLARKMLKGFPNVRRWADTGDVLQGASLRLLRTLDALRPADTREFFALAAVQVRRELLDLARHYGGPRGVGANHDSRPPDGAAADPPAGGPGPGDLDRWCALHEAAERLPAVEREVFGLTFYHGWTQDQIADLLQVDVRTVRRRWQSACRLLTTALGGDLPAG